MMSSWLSVLILVLSRLVCCLLIVMFWIAVSQNAAACLISLYICIGY